MDGIASSARVTTDRPQRYGKQLVSHLTRRSVGSWDEESGTGELSIASGSVALRCAEDALVIDVTAAPEALDQVEDVVGRHLVRFGTRDELVVEWVRADGSPGTVQRHPGD